MGRRKGKTQTTSFNSSKGKKESRSERRAREEAEQEAIEQCQRLLPYAGGCIFVFIVIFALYVRSVPKRQPVLVNKEMNDQQYSPMDDFRLDSVSVDESSGEMTETWVGNEDGLNDDSGALTPPEEQTIEL
mmetsp:Transcript_11874/g.17869  ORF Transcript_11874/g.17869 Transcript_11874/m.17869 type:complete len:131 (+) Transcript_11874:74-466(+)